MSRGSESKTVRATPLRARIRETTEQAILAAAEEVFAEMGRYQQTYPQAWGKKTDTMRELFERLDSEMQRGVHEKALRPQLADVAGVFLIGMMRALVMRAALQGGGALVDHTDTLLDLFFDGAS